VKLREAQTWFADAVTTEAAARAAPANRWLTAGPRLDASERLAIYRRAYHARLVECLADDYPTLQAALGDDAFEALSSAYIARHPSTSPSLNAFGRHMAAHCASGPALPHGAFAADLAALEWAIVEVIHAPSAEPLSAEALGSVPPDAWGAARLEPTPALRVVRTAYPVNAYYQAHRDGTNPPIPAPAQASTAVYRSGPTVWRMDLTLPMDALLSRLVSGATLGEALEAATASLGDQPEDVAAARVTGWFREWVSSGLFARVVV
jgi:hypothetical protein